MNTNANFTCISGGANGADYTFGMFAKDFNIPCRHLYFKGYRPTSNCNTELPLDEFNEAITVIKTIISKGFRRLPTNNFIQHLLARDYWQAELSDAIYAVSRIDFSNHTVYGGTGWAVEVAKLQEKPIFVFDQIRDNWYFYDYETKQFYRKDIIPILTLNFAGIGARELNENGYNAIRKLFYENFT